MREIFRLVFLGTFIVGSTVMANNEKPEDKLHVFHLVERNGSCIAIGCNIVPVGSEDHRKLKKSNESVHMRQLETIPRSRIKNKNDDPKLNEKKKKFRKLTERIIKLEEKEPKDDWVSYEKHELLLEQMCDRWLGISPDTALYYEVDMAGKKVKSNIGALALPMYNWPPINVLNVPYKQTKADFIKPKLFSINGQFYSVLGDTQVAHHEPVIAGSERLASLILAGNPLYYCSDEIPPELQSCGKDLNGYIWLSDSDGHIAFYNTKIQEYVQNIVVVNGARRILIPGDNKLLALFARIDSQKDYLEYHVNYDRVPEVTLATNARVIPADTKQILFCDLEKIVFLTEDAVKVVETGKDIKIIPIQKASDDAILEGVFVPELSKIYLLLTKKPVSSSDVFDVRRNWDNGRILQISIN